MNKECLKNKVYDAISDESDRFDDYFYMHKGIDCKTQCDFGNFFFDQQNAMNSAKYAIGALPETATADDILSVFDGAKSNFTLFARFVVFKILQDLGALI